MAARHLVACSDTAVRRLGGAGAMSTRRGPAPSTMVGPGAGGASGVAPWQRSTLRESTPALERR